MKRWVVVAHDTTNGQWVRWRRRTLRGAVRLQRRLLRRKDGRWPRWIGPRIYRETPL